MSAVPDPSCKRGKPNIVGQISTPIDIKPGCRFAPRCPYAKDICKEAEPESKEVEREHFVSCYLI
jgi:oligopeptide transport system ATP-binding protein